MGEVCVYCGHSKAAHTKYNGEIEECLSDERGPHDMGGDAEDFCCCLQYAVHFPD